MNFRYTFILIILIFFAGSVFAASGNDARQALDWLYHYMQYPDKLTYSEDFFADNVNVTVQAKREMPWGEYVPASVWQNFVLPLRVNNETLDNFRVEYYPILRERVKGMSMKEAALEVNHWCHEMATYQSADPRTSSPLSVISQSTGRCGEESTLCVAALRAVGIPARQIYTPRWAHTDDNHAWVEVWVDGKWCFLGACEPSPNLNMAWFGPSASRAMLMTTDVCSNYIGEDEILVESNLYTTINVTPNYTDAQNIHVCVVDSTGSPVSGAKVDFCIYNYAEFHPVATKYTNPLGNADILAGHGDMFVWATDGYNFGFKKINADFSSPLEYKIVLDKNYSCSLEKNIDIITPRLNYTPPIASQAELDCCNQRIALEDSIRSSRLASRMIKEDSIVSILCSWKLDDSVIVPLLLNARSNGPTLFEFLKEQSPDNRDLALRLLRTLNDKDLRDISIDVLRDCMTFASELQSQRREISDDVVQYVLSPRVEWEHLRPYRRFFSDSLPDSLILSWQSDPQKLAEWCASEITIDKEGNYSELRISPEIVWKGHRADSRSREIFCVGVLRSIGVPAKFDEVSQRAMYAVDDESAWKWNPLDFSMGNNANSVLPTVRVDFINQDKSSRIIPTYYTHFTISKIVDGIPNLLEYPDGTSLADGKLSLDLTPGQYMLVTGTRLASGDVLSNVRIFRVNSAEIDNAESIAVQIVLRSDSTKFQVIGSLNAENLYHDIVEDSDKSLLSTAGRNMYAVILVKSGDEPSAHILNDLAVASNSSTDISNKVIVLFESKEDIGKFNRSIMDSLPENVVLGIDKESASRKELVESLNLTDGSLPIAIVADSFNKVYFVSQGYTINLPEILTRAFHSAD
ncbi:MAG: transglutaminase-like domain-containing protein [Clostridium sp.]|nr:transglutaminase-like domain-containing protein [Clostridium sp.]